MILKLLKRNTNLVRHKEYEKHLGNFKKLVGLANNWADYFIKTPKLVLREFKRLPGPELYHRTCLLKWRNAGILNARRLVIQKSDALDRACNNKAYSIDFLLKKDYINEGFYNDIVSYIPDIDSTETYQLFIEAPKKYIPFLAEIGSIPFQKVIFYKDDDSSRYYYESNGNLYINYYHEIDPREVIYEVIAKKKLTKVSDSIWELKAFQNLRMSFTDKQTLSMNDRFVNDYIAHKMGQSNDAFINSFFRQLKIK